MILVNEHDTQLMAIDIYGAYHASGSLSLCGAQSDCTSSLYINVQYKVSCGAKIMQRLHEPHDM